MEHGEIELGPILWFLGWALALAALFFAGLRLPLQTRLTRGKSLLYNVGVVVLALVVAILASTAIILHDVHIDLTREKSSRPRNRRWRLWTNFNNRCG